MEFGVAQQGMKFRRDDVERNTHPIFADDMNAGLVDEVLTGEHSQNIADHCFAH